MPRTRSLGAMAPGPVARCGMGFTEPRHTFAVGQSTSSTGTPTAIAGSATAQFDMPAASIGSRRSAGWIGLPAAYTRHAARDADATASANTVLPSRPEGWSSRWRRAFSSASAPRGS